MEIGGRKRKSGVIEQRNMGDRKEKKQEKGERKRRSGREGREREKVWR